MLGQNSYTLICSVTGDENLNSSVSYRWTKNDDTQAQISEVLSFSSLRLSDAGQYTCRATVSSPYLDNDITVVDSQDVTIQSELIKPIRAYT